MVLGKRSDPKYMCTDVQDNQRTLERLSAKLQRARDSLTQKQQSFTLDASSAFIPVDQSIRPDSVLLLKPRRTTWNERITSRDEISDKQLQEPKSASVNGGVLDKKQGKSQDQWWEYDVSINESLFWESH